MSYVVAKCFSEKGAVAHKLTGETLNDDIEWMDELTKKWLANGVQILVVGNFEIYSEYKPVTYANSRGAFEECIKSWFEELI